MTARWAVRAADDQSASSAATDSRTVVLTSNTSTPFFILCKHSKILATLEGRIPYVSATKTIDDCFGKRCRPKCEF